MPEHNFLSASAAATGTAAAEQRNRQNRRKPRASATVYTSFTPKQIAGFKEAFSMIDTDSDGLISRADVGTMLSNLGMDASPGAVAKYMSSALASSQAKGEPTINFTQFLTMFGEHLDSLDEATELREAFACFDEHDEGLTDAAELRYWLKEVGDRMTDDEIDRLLGAPFMDRAGRKFDYASFVEAIKMSEPAEVE